MKTQTHTLLAGLALALVLTLAPRTCPAAEPSRDGVFIHLSAGPDNPHRVLMALKVSQVMAEGGKAVLVYCDIAAVRLLVEGAPDVSHNEFDSSKAQIEKLLAMGVRIRACPSCLKAAGKAETDLLSGIKPADREEFFTFTPGRILSIDY